EAVQRTTFSLDEYARNTLVVLKNLNRETSRGSIRHWSLRSKRKCIEKAVKKGAIDIRYLQRSIGEIIVSDADATGDCIEILKRGCDLYRVCRVLHEQWMNYFALALKEQASDTADSKDTSSDAKDPSNDPSQQEKESALFQTLDESFKKIVKFSSESISSFDLKKALYLEALRYFQVMESKRFFQNNTLSYFATLTDRFKEIRTVATRIENSMRQTQKKLNKDTLSLKC
ncbi:hypothetical protein ENBRE01_2041, partial [Enteropsectra breve]